MNKKEIILKLQAPLIEAGNSMGKFKGCERERHNRGENISVSFVSQLVQIELHLCFSDNVMEEKLETFFLTFLSELYKDTYNQNVTFQLYVMVSIITRQEGGCKYAFGQ